MLLIMDYLSHEMTAEVRWIAHDFETLANTPDSGSTHITVTDEMNVACTATMSIVLGRLAVGETLGRAVDVAELSFGAC